MIPLLSYQKLLGYVDGIITSPTSTITVTEKKSSNPAFLTWYESDQRAIILLHSSLTEEAAAEAIGLTSSHQVWTALQAAYSSVSVERVQNLRDTLRQTSKGTNSIADYGRKFKIICDQLSAIGQPVDEMDKSHWFLCGLGPSFETFSTAIRAIKPGPSFRDLLSQAESHELFLHSLHGSTTPQAAFVAHQSRSNNSHRGRGRFSSPRGANSGGRGRFHRRPPHCQLCRIDGHYATQCPSLHTFASQASSSDANLAQAFHAQCHVNNGTPDWYVDSGATAHMTPSLNTLGTSTPYSGNANVIFRNGQDHETPSSSRPM